MKMIKFDKIMWITIDLKDIAFSIKMSMHEND